jgi:hypothetical protein
MSDRSQEDSRYRAQSIANAAVSRRQLDPALMMGRWRDLGFLDRQSAEFVGEAMIDVAVVRFVGADDQHDVAQGRAFRQPPIALGDALVKP